MSDPSNPAFSRIYAGALANRLAEPRRFIHVVAGPRQVGKTTLVRQATSSSAVPAHRVSADEPLLRGPDWIEAQWQAARDLAAASPDGAVLVVDEVQKVQGWSETVKRLWDEDTASGAPLRCVLLGSAPLLVQRGLTESLAGRFEVLRVPHWSFPEMRAAFGWSLDQYLVYGGYPGAAPLIDEPARWRRYVLDSLVETTLSRDILLLSRVEKPALLRRLLDLGCRYSGRVLSYTKMLGQLQEHGNTTTLAHYLDLLAGAGMLVGLQKYAGEAVRTRSSSPKLQVMNTALLSAVTGLDLDAARSDREHWGRLVESAVGAHLANEAAGGSCELHYWRERNREVDFVISDARRLAAVEVKSGRARDAFSGMDAFSQSFKPDRKVLVGGDGVSVEEFLSAPVERWLTGR